MTKLYTFTLLISFLFIFSILFEQKYKSKFKYKIIGQVDAVLKERLGKINYLLIFLFLIISQAYYLNFETIDWDINSYLVASQDVLRGNLPYETQWESKQVLFYYLYALIIKISAGNLIIFKLINDIVLFSITIILFLIVDKLTNDKVKALFSSLLFTLIMAQPWASAEFSEIYCLLFISGAFLILVSDQINKTRILIIGVLLASSSLINIGSAIFTIPFFLYVYKKKESKLYINFFTGLAIPHSLFLFIYFLRGELNVYWSTLVIIPNAYRGEEMNFFKEFINFLRSLYEFDQFIYVAVFYLFISLFLELFKLKNIKESLKTINNISVQFIFISILFYYLASHGYYHHLIFFIYFLPLLVVKLKEKFSVYIFYLIMIFATTSIFSSQIQTSIYNLQNLDSIYANYPLKKLSKEIDSQFNSNYEVLAFDTLLVLFYLDKPNFSYIVHPTNHNEDFITDNLKNIGKSVDDEPKKLVDLEPDVIMCSNNQIIHCEIYDYKKNYKELDSLKYRQDPTLQFYDNQTFQFRVFIKEP